MCVCPACGNGSLTRAHRAYAQGWRPVSRLYFQGQEGGREVTASMLPESGTGRGPGCLGRPTHFGEAQKGMEHHVNLPSLLQEAPVSVQSPSRGGLSYGEP